MNTPESIYSKAGLLAADAQIASSLDSMRQLCIGWKENISPFPIHKLLSEKLTVPEGRKYHGTLALQLAKVSSDNNKLTANHARLWQFLSLRFFPSNPQGMMQFQMELATILEELARSDIKFKVGDCVRQYAIGDPQPISPCNQVLVVYADNGEIEIEGDGIPLWRANGTRIDNTPFRIALCDGKNCLNSVHFKPVLRLV